MTAWYDSLWKGECLEREDPAPSMAKLAAMIAAHPVADERAAYNEYYQRHLFPKTKAWHEGVPGFGTHAAIDAKRKAWFEGRNSSAPKVREAKTSEQIRALGGELVAFVKRTTEDHKFVSEMMAASGCYGKKTEFQTWRHATSERPMSDSVDDVLAKSVPPLVGAQQADIALKKLTAEQPEGQAQSGSLLESGYLAYAQLLEEAPLAAAYGELAVIGKAGDSARYPKLTEELGTVLANRVRQAKLSPKVSAPAAVTSLLAKFAVKGGRATSALEHNDRMETDQFEKNGKLYERSYRLVYDAVGIEFVVNDRKKWLPDLPGLPAAMVCEVHAGHAIKYSKGFGRKLGKWELQEGVSGMIVCPK
ncbi:MAG: hypothetical protein H7138_26895 [Myxococcales bacterium]|nr:hypothetical protein [Myxococcales bacterium]